MSEDAESAVNGGAVPFVLGPVPPFLSRGDTATGCQLVASAGTLLLRDDRSFRMTYMLTSSCPRNDLRITSTEDGTYALRGRAIDFRMFDGEKDVIYRGVSRGRTIEVAGASF